jgi:hypothetical protein
MEKGLYFLELNYSKWNEIKSFENKITTVLFVSKCPEKGI